MAPQNVSFIENSTDNDEDDKSISPVPAAPASGETARSDSNLSERLSRLNISRGDKTYRVQLHADGREPTALDQQVTSTIIITIIIIIITMGCAPFTTDPFATGPFTTRLVVKGSVIIIIIIIIMIVIIVFGICIQFFLSIFWSGVIMMVVYEEVDSETDMVAD